VSAKLEASKPAPQVVNNPQSRAHSNKAATLRNRPSRFTAWRLFVLPRSRFFEIASVLVRFDHAAEKAT